MAFDVSSLWQRACEAHTVTRRRTDISSLPEDILQLIFLEYLAASPRFLCDLRAVDRGWKALANRLVNVLRISPIPAPFDLKSNFPNTNTVIIENNASQLVAVAQIEELLSQLESLPRLSFLALGGIGPDAAAALGRLSRLAHLKALDIARCEITELPDAVRALSSLEILRAAECSLTSLGGGEDAGPLALPSGLRCLDLSGNKLTSLPESMSLLTTLTSLNLSGNKLAGELSFGLQVMGQLADLNLSSNGLEVLPANLSAATALTRLCMADCDLAVLPDRVLAQLEGLRELDVSGNWRLGRCPEAVTALNRLTLLDLSGCGLTGMAPILGCATQLVQLHLSSNDLQQVPECVSCLTQLRSLHLDFNCLSSLPDFLSGLGHLTALDAAGNALQDLPATLAALSSLKHLALGSNAFRQVPESLMCLAGLQELDLSCNHLQHFPGTLCSSLRSLDFLSLAGNSLRSLPAELSRLSRLAWLDVSDNRLAGLPPCIADMGSLQVLKLRGNCLASPRPLAFKRWLSRLRSRVAAAAVPQADSTAGFGAYLGAPVWGGAGNASTAASTSRARAAAAAADLASDSDSDTDSDVEQDEGPANALGVTQAVGEGLHEEAAADPTGAGDADGDGAGSDGEGEEALELQSDSDGEADGDEIGDADEEDDEQEWDAGPPHGEESDGDSSDEDGEAMALGGLEAPDAAEAEVHRDDAGNGEEVQAMDYRADEAGQEQDGEAGVLSDDGESEGAEEAGYGAAAAAAAGAEWADDEAGAAGAGHVGNVEDGVWEDEASGSEEEQDAADGGDEGPEVEVHLLEMGLGQAHVEIGVPAEEDAAGAAGPGSGAELASPWAGWENVSLDE